MRIFKLQVENVRKVKAIEINPQGDGTVLISGNNGSGKSSVIDSIWYAIGGTRDIPDGVVRKGSEEAVITIEIGDIRIRRIISRDKGPVLKVWKDGVQIHRPQQMLNEWMDQCGVDATEFIRTSPQDRVNMLLRMAGKQGELLELNSEYSRLEQVRRDLGRDIKRMRGVVEEKVIPSETPEAPIDIDELQRKAWESQSLKDQRHKQKKVLESRQRDLADAKLDLEEITQEIARLQSRKSGIEASISELQEQVVAEEKTLEDMPTGDDIQTLTQRIIDANRLNALVEEREEYEIMAANLSGMEKNYRLWSSDMADILADKRELLGSVSEIVEGLTIDDKGDILYQGHPFALASSAEQLHVSTIIATKRNPKFKILTIKDGSLLDDASMAVLEKLSTEQEYQIWIEYVDDTGEVGFYLEDGELKN